MDRRQRKTRNAIFSAFIELLSEKHYSNITVGEIIEKADVGRATFYSHFETKDFLLKALLDELFCHIFDSLNNSHNHKHIFDCNAPESVFLHLIQHLKKNDNNILKLFTSKNNELFTEYFKANLKKLVESQLDTFPNEKTKKLPKELRITLISSAFAEIIKWWVKNGMKESEEELAEYFYMSI